MNLSLILRARNLRRQSERTRQRSREIIARSKEVYEEDRLSKSGAQIILSLPSDLKYLSAARSIAQAFLERTGADEETVERVVSVLGELCANVVRHAGLEPDSCYRVQIKRLPECILTVVADHGKGFDRRLVVEPDGERESGRGVWLTEMLSDEVAYYSTGQGTRIRVKTNVPPPPSALDT
jgi:anti-sigma regulatory factor (Ser/Thr protein kinase)